MFTRLTLEGRESRGAAKHYRLRRPYARLGRLHGAVFQTGIHPG